MSLEHPERDGLTEANRAAWNAVAANYEPEVDADVALLRSGGTSLLAPELDALTPLLRGGGRAIHLQCSHGTDTLSLWKLGAREVVGVDLSEQMLDLARRKTAALDAPARWYRSDVLDLPAELKASGDIVFTGKGALPWVLDLAAWARGVAEIVAPSGHLFIFEAHPLNGLWESGASEVRLREGADYFSREARANSDFPAMFLERTALSGEAPLQAFERQWTLGEIVTELAGAGFRLIRLEEHGEQFWRHFAKMPGDVLRRLPHTFSLLMSRE